jgi:F-type H+-transporting ATPase subunit epsilon
MSTAKDLRLVLVTPETTLLDEPVQALRFPLFDGQAGVLPGRAPMVGRLGFGELKITTSAGEQSYFVDGGFVQVKGPVVSLLTNRAFASDQINADEAAEQLRDASQRVPTTDPEFQSKERDQERARRMLAMTGR